MWGACDGSAREGGIGGVGEQTRGDSDYRLAGLWLAASQRLGRNQRPLGDAKAHVAVFIDPCLGQGRPAGNLRTGVCV